VYRTHDKRGLLCAASALRGPAFYSQFVTSVWTRAYIWDPRFQTACMQAGVYSGLTCCVAYRGVPQSRVGYARLGLPARLKISGNVYIAISGVVDLRASKSQCQ